METPASQSLEIIFSLALIIVLIVAVGWIMRRFSGGPGMQNRQLKIVAAISLGSRERIAVVQVGERQILVGITAQQINKLLELEQPIDVSVENSEFARKLQSLLKKPTQEKSIADAKRHDNDTQAADEQQDDPEALSGRHPGSSSKS
ncbi:MAG: flagellar biosynthetic protein FliO [unclassified Hahellaceae]|nr:flagellar biosynthetic protein FliO [Hahellaceae bacterium]|tara:strand:+ start:74175 stop:74615 length:441 start_codon:yes stop_codon:yes gene_type:complete